MYTPKHFKLDDQNELFNFLKANSFGALITHFDNDFQATHIPFSWSEDKKSIFGHIALGNSQKHAIIASDKALMIIQGAHSYISPTWYDHENVPTWNYQAVHIKGKLDKLDDKELFNSLNDLSQTYEEGRSPKFDIYELTPEFLKKELRGIIGFKLDIEDIQVSYKLSQNRSEKDFNNIISELEQTDDRNANDVANAMRSLKKSK